APFLPNGGLIGLAVVSRQRLSNMPGVPTMGEAWPEGPDYFKQMQWHGMWAPARTPREVVAALNAAANQTASDARVKERVEKMGLFLHPVAGVDDTAAFMKREIDTWTSVLANSSVKKAIEATAN